MAYKQKAPAGGYGRGSRKIAQAWKQRDVENRVSPERTKPAPAACEEDGAHAEAAPGRGVNDPWAACRAARENQAAALARQAETVQRIARRCGAQSEGEERWRVSCPHCGRWLVLDERTGDATIYADFKATPQPPCPSLQKMRADARLELDPVLRWRRRRP